MDRLGIDLKTLLDNYVQVAIPTSGSFVILFVLN